MKKNIVISILLLFCVAFVAQQVDAESKIARRISQKAHASQSASSVSDDEAIDLGLSVKWASHNFGTSLSQSTGGYYSWGEMVAKSDFSAGEYKYTESSSSCTDIGSDISGTRYDIVRATWGGAWRMPTIAEFQELVDKCTWKWITFKGVEGMKVVGPNGNSIFLPFAGYREGTDLRDGGAYGYYWSGTLDSKTSVAAHRLQICIYGNYSCDESSSRYQGFSIRPVK
ncbi:MAG: fibrobacter succinogenes major paralogous domain-containing protein [Muribaculaceae bacterium]|jgi:hypothetical protein|nr:fibrobacter succinogenes major paralogous domain-containing protein [Muribaculaceae bacterium]